MIDTHQFYWHWIIQLQLWKVRCSQCNECIPACVTYWRWCYNEDGLDERGRDLCDSCKRKFQ